MKSPRNPSDLTIRSYEETDLEAAACLWVTTWQVTMPGIDFALRRNWIVERLSTQTATGTTTRCAIASRSVLVGFSMIEPGRNYLEQLAVDPGWLGQGVGLVLLDDAKRICADRLALRVNQDNSRAVRFYTREGFRIVGEGVNPGGRLRTWDMEWRAP